MAAPLLNLFSKRCNYCHTLHSKLSSRSNSGKSISTPQESYESESSPVKWQSVIGLEIHAQIKSASKLFSGASTVYGGSTNTQVAFFDAALPGTLPVINKTCVEAGVLTAMALKCQINRVSTFDRKHYFYADLPAGYQITQYRRPLAIGGEVDYVYQCSKTRHVERRSAKLEQIQLEQDSGKSLHDADAGLSLIDLNRAGIGLMEIITKPVFCKGDDASSFVKELTDILYTIKTCDGRMAEGSLRVDANISVHKPGTPLGVRTEIKNLNSLRSIRLAIDNEIERQIDILNNGGIVENVTRSYNADTGETVTMRDKEKILDYRFMPEANLPPLVIHTQSTACSSTSSKPVVLEELAARLPPLPETRRLYLEDKYKLTLYQSMRLVRKKVTENFETLVTKYGCSASETATFLLSYYIPFKEEDKYIEDKTLAEIIHLYGSHKVSRPSVSMLLNEVWELDGGCDDVSKLAESKGLLMVSQEAVVEAMEGVLSRNPKMVKSYKKGKKNQLSILADKVLKKVGNRANVDDLRAIIHNRIIKD